MSLSRSSRRRITSWKSVDNLLQAAKLTSATWRHTQGANHRLYMAAWTKDSPNHSLKEPTQPEIEDQEHGLGADDAAASVISAKENTRAKG